MVRFLRRLGSALRNGWLIVGIAVAVLATLEAGLSLAFYIDDRLTWKPPDVRFEADTYDGAPWALDYYREYASLDLRWKPYAYWRRVPYKGSLINVDGEGLRVTTGTTPEATVPLVAMFGGSTMWGAGVRDAFTIPSIVAGNLRRNGVNAAVINFGESGYVSTQERIVLEVELQRGRRPDVVVFYDGINDTYSAFQQGIAGLPQNEINRAREFNLLTRSRLGSRAMSVLRDVASDSAIRRFIMHFLPEPGPSGVGFRGPAPRVNIDLVPTAIGPRLSEQVVDVYVSNMEAVRSLGERYGFRSLFYWQPTLLDKPHLTTYEKRYQPDMTPMAPFFEQTYELIRNGMQDRTRGLRDVTRVFANVQGPVFIDHFHLGERGNDVVGSIIASDILAELSTRGVSKSSGAATSR